MRKLTVLVAALMLLTMLFACAPSTPEPAEPSNGVDSEPTNLSLLMYTNADIQAKVVETLKPFEEEFNAKVEVILSPIADFDQKLTSMIGGGTAPDVFFVAEMSVPQYYEQGLLADLTEFKSDAEWDIDDFVTGQIDHYTYDDKLIGVPFSGAPQVMFYNKTAIEAAGMKTPTELVKDGEWTIDAMLEIARTTTDSSTGTYGISFVRPGEWESWDVALTPALRLYGGKPWSEDFTTVEINSEASQKSLQTFSDLMFVDKAHPMPGSSPDFLAGQVVLLPVWYNYVKSLIDMPFEWDVVPTPINDSGEPLGVMGSAGYGVYAEGDNIDLAKEMVKFLTSSETIGGSMLNVFFPTRVSAIKSESFRTGNDGEYVHASEESFNLALSDEMLDILPVKPAHPEYAKVSQVIKLELEKIYAGASTVEEATAAMAEGMEPLMVK